MRNDRYCANCCRVMIPPTPWYSQSAGRIWHFCSQRCQERFAVDPARCLIVSPLHED